MRTASDCTYDGQGVINNDEDEDSEAVYVRMRRHLLDCGHSAMMDVRRSRLDMSDTPLGSGQFGSVCRATYRIDGEPPLTVAVKTLKRSRNPAKQVRVAGIQRAVDSVTL